MDDGGDGGNHAAAAAVTDDLFDYLRFQSSTSSSSSSSEAVRRHALEQLVEFRLGPDVAAAASRWAAGRGGRRGPPTDEDVRAAAEEVIGTPSFRMLRGAVGECSSRLRLRPASPATASSDAAGGESESAEAGIGTTPRAEAPALAPASFSLFDMLDSGGGAFALPPRITAHQVIEAHRREGNAGDTVAMSVDGDNEGSTGSTALELLEKAEDAEDLSPDPDAWEEVRAILYGGLLSSPSPGGGDGTGDGGRYLRVHESLVERCRGAALAPQLWGLASNQVGALLELSRRLEGTNDRGTADLCWDIARSLLDALADLALDHVRSCVGNEREVERMLLGMCMIYSNDFSSCVMAMMEPMASRFEVWARFVPPQRFLAIVRASGLGGAARRRCKCLGKIDSVESIWNMVQTSGGGEECGVSLADMERCNFLQSLSILRAILFRCGGSEEVVTEIHDQFATDPEVATMLPRYLLPNGIAGPDDVQALLGEVEEERRRSKDRARCLGVDVSRNSVLEPFRSVLRAKESDDRLVDRDLEVLCDQTVRLIQR